jgi:hypothetical protein
MMWQVIPWLPQGKVEGSQLVAALELAAHRVQGPHGSHRGVRATYLADLHMPRKKGSLPRL